MSSVLNFDVAQAPELRRPGAGEPRVQQEKIRSVTLGFRHIFGRGVGFYFERGRHDLLVSESATRHGVLRPRMSRRLQ
jgi:hypothetical protein